MLGHVNWGDLYFDLFYVAAAFQLSHAFKDEPTGVGLLYFLACYLSIFSIWNDKLTYDGKFVSEDDVFHRVLEVIHLCILGTLVVNIQPAEIMKATQASPNMLTYGAGLVFANMGTLYLYWDVKHFVVGGPEAVWEGRIQFKRKFISFSFHLAAAIVAGSDYVMGDGDEEHSNHVPAYLIIIGYLVDTVLYPLLLYFVIIPRMNKTHHEFNVPLNLEYTLHRIGEWVMLILGESVLSLLTLQYNHSWDTHAREYSVSFYSGLVTVTLFQYLFFRTQPSHAKDHALRRSTTGAFLFYYAHIFYSASLILMGCSYKMILLSYHEEEGPPASTIAQVYCWSMTVSFVSLDVLIMSHRGCASNFGRLCPKRKCAWIPAVCSLLLIASWVITLTMSWWVPSLEILSVCGLLVVMAQVMIRTIGLRYFPVSKEAMERAIQGDYEDSEMDHRRWPNVTQAQVQE